MEQPISKLMLIQLIKLLSTDQETIMSIYKNYHISHQMLLNQMILLIFTPLLDQLLELQETLLNYNVEKIKLNMYH